MVSVCDERKHYINSLRALEIVCVCIICTDCYESLGLVHRFSSGLLNTESRYSTESDHTWKLGRKLLSCGNRQG